MADGPPPTGPPGPPPVAPGPDVSIIGRFLGPSIFLYTVAVTLTVMRLLTRLRPTPRFGWDDAAVTLAVVSPIFFCRFLDAATTIHQVN